MAEAVVVGGEVAGCASGNNMGLPLNQVDARIVRVMRQSLDIYLTLARDGFAFDLRETPQLLLAPPLNSSQPRAERPPSARPE